MFQVIHSGDLLAWDYLWQLTLFLGLGLVARALFSRRPARAHRFLLLAMLAALVSPVLTQAVRRGGWGLLTPGKDGALATTVGSPATASPPAARTLVPSGAMPVFATNRPDPSIQIAGPHAGNLPHRKARPPKSDSQPGSWLVSTAWRTLILAGWLVLTVLNASRLAIGLILGMNVIRRARLVKNEMLGAAATAAATRLGVGHVPELRLLPQVRCPAIWCWARRPMIVLPEDAESTTASVDWAGLFCHELAHWVRRDHWSSLIAEVLVCALPWHPLAWLARYRLGQLSEMACDDWVLASGLPATDYAESLLSLVPQAQGSLALAAVSSRRGLFARVKHILDEQRTSPVVGVPWAFASTIAILLAISAVALAQNRRMPLNKEHAHAGQTSAPPTESSKKRTIRGTVIGPDGKPATGATVSWIGQRRPPLPYVALPKDQDSSRAIRTEVLAGADTGADGRFIVTADVDPHRYHRFNGWDLVLLVKARGAGMLAQHISPDTADVTLRLSPEAIIRGRLLTPGGMPASGSRIVLDGFYDGQYEEGMYFGPMSTDEEVPSYWPQPRGTDTDGRFTLEGLPQGTYATLSFWHPEFAVDEVTVNTTVDGTLTPELRAFEITPVKPEFTHTLEPARPVQGRVTDKQSGKPLSGLLVQMTPMRSHGGMPFYSRTDADGRYRVSGHAGAETYFTAVYPPADSGYLAASDQERNWPRGAGFLQKDFALDKGRIVRGRVIDGDTKQPITGAAVIYRAKWGNRNNHDYDLRNTVVTNTEGRFAITALPGQGFLAVETADRSYVRTRLEGTELGGAFPQGFVAIDVPKVGEPTAALITVRKGITLEAKAIGPDGKVVLDLIGFCEGIDAKLIDKWNHGLPFADGIFRLPGADPARTYRVYLLQPERAIGAVVDIKPDPRAKQPIKVTLVPTAKVHGKVITAGGSPMQLGQVFSWLVYRLKDGQMTHDDVYRNAYIYEGIVGQKAMLSYSDRSKVRPGGEFVIDTLLSGTHFCVTAAMGSSEAVVPISPLKPGEDRDLGRITLKERPR